MLGRALFGVPCLLASWAVVALAFGFVLCLLARILLVALAGHHTGMRVNVPACLAVAAAVAAVVLFWCAARNPAATTGDDLLAQVNRAYIDSIEFPDSRHPSFSRDGLIDSDDAAFIDGPLQDLILLGPRQVLQVLATSRAIRSLHAVDRDRAAQVLYQLLRLDHGPPVAALRQPGESPSAVMPVLAYLLFYGWIDTSKDTRRVWTTTAARTEMGVAD